MMVEKNEHEDRLATTRAQFKFLERICAQGAHRRQFAR